MHESGRFSGAVLGVLLIIGLVGVLVAIGIGQQRSGPLAMTEENVLPPEATAVEDARPAEQTERCEQVAFQEETQPDAASEAETQRRRETEEQRIQEAEKQRALIQSVAEREARLDAAWQWAGEAQRLIGVSPAQSAILAGKAMQTVLQEGLAPEPSWVQTLIESLNRDGFRPLEGHKYAVEVLAISPDGRWLVSAGADKSARLWDLLATSSATSKSLDVHKSTVCTAAFSPDLRWLATAHEDGSVALWPLAADGIAGQPTVLRKHNARIQAMAISADSRWLLTGGGDTTGNDNTARLWSLTAADVAAESPMELRGHERPILAAAITPDNRFAITASEDSTIRLFDLTARFPAAEQTVLRGHESWVKTIAVSGDSRWLASGSYDSTARLWDLAAKDSAAQPVVLRGHEGWITSVAASADGRWIATASLDQTARLWKILPGKPPRESIVLRGHESRVISLAFSPDQRWLITGSGDRTVRLWDLHASDPATRPLVLRGHLGPVTSLAVSPGSRWLASASGDVTAVVDPTIRLWDLNLYGLLGTYRSAGAQRLPDQEDDSPLRADRSAAIPLNRASTAATRPSRPDAP